MLSGLRSRRGIAIAAYSSILVVIGIGMAVVLPAGDDLKAAPQAPKLADVSGSAVTCLGERVAFVQSGVFLDVHEYDSRVVGGLGPQLAEGRVDRESGQVQITGKCAAQSVLGSVPFDADAVVGDRTGVSGEATAGSETFDFQAVGAEDSGEADSVGERLTGGELLSRILLAVAAVIVTARLVGSAFRFIGQPRVIGEITAGILLGPSLLGLLLPEVTAYLFPRSVTDVLGVLAQLGLIFFMFLIGLELDHSLIRGSGRTALLISHYSIAVPLMLGVGSALLVYPVIGSGDFTGFALFMGAAMAITAFPVLARILADSGLHKTRLGAIAITCAAVDDLTAWCLLAVVVAIVKASGPGDAIMTVSFALVFIVAMVAVVRPVADRLLRLRNGAAALGATAMSFLIVGLFLSAWTTELIGIHAIFGAFMFGAVLPRSSGATSRVVERLEDVTVLLLLPIFFAVVGLSTQFGLVSGGQLWAMTGLIITIAIVGKIGGSLIAGLAAGESLRSSAVIGVLMNARGITEIVILTIGQELGVISPALFTIMVLMALVTTFMTTPILSLLYPRKMVERDIMTRHHENAARRDFASRRVMVGVAQPGAARSLVRVASWLRGSDGQPARVVLASVVAPPGHEQVRMNLNDRNATSTAAGNLTRLARELEGAGVGAEIVTRIGTDRSGELSLVAQQQMVDMIVVGAHDAYVRDRPFAGVVDDLLRSAPADVVVVLNPDAVLQLAAGPVGVWLSGEPTDVAALDLAASVAKGLEREVIAVSVGSRESSTGSDPVEATTVLPEGSTELEVADALAGAAVLVVASLDACTEPHLDVITAVIRRRAVPILVIRPRRAPADETAVGREQHGDATAVH